MRVNIECGPAYAMAYCYLSLGEELLVESGAMAAMSDGVSVSAAAPGGAVKGLLRKVAGGESFFMGKYTAAVDGAWVAVAPKFPGDVASVKLDGSVEILATSGAFLASAASVKMSVVSAGWSNMLMREGVTMLKFSGNGTLVMCSYGGLQMFELAAGQTIVVDTGHVVGYTSTMSTQVGPLTSVSSSVATGEGLAMRLTGPGFVWMQTRAEQQLRSWLFPEREQNKK